MKFKYFYYLQEALRPSQYRQHMKDKSYKDLYDDFFQGKHRKHFPFKADRSYIEQNLQKKVADYLKKINFGITDYMAGIAQELGEPEKTEITDKQGNKRTVYKKKKTIKIGKLLQDNPELQKKYNEDPSRTGAKQVQNFIVISRHPYDIAGMSTDRGWTSCMNLQSGCNRQFVAKDIEEGSIIAYLVRGDDKNINNPIARILFKPHNHSDDSDERLLVPDTTYGAEIPGFKEAVTQIINTGINAHATDGTYSLNPNLYQDHDTGLAYKQGDNIETGIDLSNLHKIPNSILSSAQFIDMIDNSPEGYEIYLGSWESFPKALRNNKYFVSRYNEHNGGRLY